jgi:hypothetical protein
LCRQLHAAASKGGLVRHPLHRERAHQLLREGWRLGCRPQGVRRKLSPGRRSVERHHKRPLSSWGIESRGNLFRSCGGVACYQMI